MKLKRYKEKEKEKNYDGILKKKQEEERGISERWREESKIWTVKKNTYTKLQDEE